MISQLLSLSERDLQEIAIALRAGRLLPPYSTAALQRVVSKEAAEPTARRFGHAVRTRIYTSSNRDDI